MDYPAQLGNPLVIRPSTWRYLAPNIRVDGVTPVEVPHDLTPHWMWAGHINARGLPRAFKPAGSQGFPPHPIRVMFDLSGNSRIWWRCHTQSCVNPTHYEFGLTRADLTLHEVLQKHIRLGVDI